MSFQNYLCYKIIIKDLILNHISGLHSHIKILFVFIQTKNTTWKSKNLMIFHMLSSSSDWAVEFSKNTMSNTILNSVQTPQLDIKCRGIH